MGRLQSAKQSFTNIFPRKSVTKMEFYQEADFYELSEMLDDESSRSSSPYFVNSPPAANMVKIERVPSAHGIGKRRPGKAPSRPDWDLDPSSSIVGNVAGKETASPPPAAGTSDSKRSATSKVKCTTSNKRRANSPIKTQRSKRSSTGSD